MDQHPGFVLIINRLTTIREPPSASVENQPSFRASCIHISRRIVLTEWPRSTSRTRGWSTGMGARDCFVVPAPRWKVTVTCFYDCRIVKDDVSVQRNCHVTSVQLLPFTTPRFTRSPNIHRVSTFESCFVGSRNNGTRSFPRY